jgi:hypothetical protein
VCERAAAAEQVAGDPHLRRLFPSRELAVRGVWEARPLAAVENDRRVISGHLERLADPFAPGDEAELLEQRVPVAPGDVDDLSRYIDVHPVEPAPLHAGQAYAATVSERLLTARELAAPVASLVGSK